MNDWALRMARTSHHTADVRLGDCDPARIAFFANFSRRMEAASMSFFVHCGVPPWGTLLKARGIVGTPLPEINTKFMKAAAFVERDVDTPTACARFPFPTTFGPVFLKFHPFLTGDNA